MNQKADEHSTQTGDEIPLEVFGSISTLSWDGMDEVKGEVKRDSIEITEVKSLRCFKKTVKNPAE